MVRPDLITMFILDCSKKKKLLGSTPKQGDRFSSRTYIHLIAIWLQWSYDITWFGQWKIVRFRGFEIELINHKSNKSFLADGPLPPRLLTHCSPPNCLAQQYQHGKWQKPSLDEIKTLSNCYTGPERHNAHHGSNLVFLTKRSLSPARYFITTSCTSSLAKSTLPPADVLIKLEKIKRKFGHYMSIWFTWVC